MTYFSFLVAGVILLVSSSCGIKGPPIPYVESERKMVPVAEPAPTAVPSPLPNPLPVKKTKESGKKRTPLKKGQQ